MHERFSLLNAIVLLSCVCCPSPLWICLILLFIYPPFPLVMSQESCTLPKAIKGTELEGAPASNATGDPSGIPSVEGMKDATASDPTRFLPPIVSPDRI